VSARQQQLDENRRLRPPLGLALRTDARRFREYHGHRARVSDEMPGWLGVLRLVVTSGEFLAVSLYRVRSSLVAHHVPVVPAVLNRISIACWNINIDGAIVIREGLCITHGNVVLGGITLIGRDATVGPWVSIGTRAGNLVGPTLGDGVTVGTHATILGQFEIGGGATVAPGSVVTGDVAAGACVSGVPARPVEPAPRASHEQQ